jgi:tetratricopeptide (TPR) repeat protein
MDNYITLEYFPQDEEVAKQLAEEFEEKHIEVHMFEKNDLKQPEVLADIKNSSCVVLLHLTEDFDYRYYLREIIKADNRCQVVAAYVTKSTYQNRYKYNEIECKEGYPLEALANDICCIMVGGYQLRCNVFNRGKLRKQAFKYYNSGEYVWALCYLLKVFKISDLQVKEKIATAYTSLMNCDKAINYYSICLPISDQTSQAEICNNLGYLYTQTRNLEFAERYLKLAIENGSGDALYNLGYLYETSWAYDSKMRRTREAYDIYCKVVESTTTSENSKKLATERLEHEATKLLARRNYAVAMQYYKAIGNGAKVAECLRNIKMLREAYEARKKQQQAK